ncbi:MAG: hypothetical protein NVS2B14_10710 [Chamaesiphon sp.]
MAHPLLFGLANGSVAALNDDRAIAQNKLAAIELKSRLMNFWLLSTPDGNWGPKSARALNNYKHLQKINEAGVGQKTATSLINTDPANLVFGFKLNGDWASRTILWMALHDQHISVNPGEINIVYFRGLNRDGTWNGNDPFVFNDRRCILIVKNGIPKFCGNWLATCDPGEYYWENPMNDKGCADIKEGQYQAWSIGDHKGQNALIQTGTITVLRGSDAYGGSRSDHRVPDTGDDFSVDQHTVGLEGSGADYNYGDPVGRWSAGCMVGASAGEHYGEFMSLVQADVREKANPGSYQHYTTIINGNEFLDMFPVS